jgi:heme exporter protein C
MHAYANPLRFQRIADAVFPWVAGVALALTPIALWLALVEAPADYQQGQAYRIMFVHVPAAWMALFGYLVVAGGSAAGFIWRHPLAEVAARAAAPIGAAFTAIALATGSIWGKPMWGTWWVWDARLTSELILLFLYIGFMSLQAAIDDPRRADKAGAMIALVGVVNVPIIYFSVKWWNTLHQGATVSLTQSPKMATTMLTGMLIMSIACWMYAIAVILIRTRAIILERERHTAWVGELQGAER